MSESACAGKPISARNSFIFSVFSHTVLDELQLPLCMARREPYPRLVAFFASPSSYSQPTVIRRL
jgi:hypothetical protein